MTDVYLAWCGLVRVHGSLIDRVAARCEISRERLLQSSLLCIALHDTGKLCTNFQEMMKAPDKKAYRIALSQNYRHEIAALWLVEQVARGLAKDYGPIPGDGILEVLAVAGHHKFLADGYLFEEERFSQALQWKPDAWTAVRAACGLASAMFKAQGWRLPQKLAGVNSITVNERLSSGKVNHPFHGLVAARACIQGLASDNRYQQFRELFTLLKGLLMAADWMASGAALRPELLDADRNVVRVPASTLPAYIREKVACDRRQRPDLKPFSGFRYFQTQCGQADGHVLAIAPTGSGKTEAALLWALNQIESGHSRKLFFLLPTMVTANSLHERIRRFFEQHNHSVALVHSTADLVFGDEKGNKDEGEADRADVRARHLRHRHFFLPVTVGTVDQLLVSLFHAGRWALKTFAAADAAIIIDEVHAYDPHTAGLIMLLVEQLRELGTRFMVMSATMPTDLQNTILNGLAPGAHVQEPRSVTVVKDLELLENARSVWEVNDHPLTTWVGAGDPVRELLNTANERGQPRRVLIVVNTVKRCQQMARILEQLGPVCYHSKFIFRDRRDKEAEIENCRPQLVVATQVVEVSLDIDYDVLLTECAPLDALAQRAGRVNRVRREAKGRLVVFPPEGGSEKVYGEPAGVLEVSWKLCQENQGPLTESDLIHLVESAYGRRSLREEPAFLEIQAQTKAAQRRLSGVLDNPHPDEDAHLVTRLEKYQEVSVIPEMFAEEARERPPWERRLFELKVPVWYFREHRLNNTDGLPVCEMQYDSVFGAQLSTTSKEADPGCCIV